MEDILKRQSIYFEKFNIQLFFPGEKTEEATPEKKRKAREEGRVAKSLELSSAVIILLGFGSLYYLGSHMFQTMYYFVDNYFNDMILREATMPFYKTILNQGIYTYFKIIGPLLLLLFTGALAINYLQVGFMFSTEPMMFDITKLNPIKGFQNIFSLKSLVEMIKMIIKIIIIGYFPYKVISAEFTKFLTTMDMAVSEVARYLSYVNFKMAMQAGLMLLILAIFDYAYQVYELNKSLMMSKDDIKDEYKNREGDPHVKQQIRKKQQEIISMAQMVDKEVPKADVVITNPTHVAVALRMEGPGLTVVAKGADTIAERIKNVAKENNIPIHRSPFIAREIFKSTEVGDQIDPKWFSAVAEIYQYLSTVNHNFKEKLNKRLN